MRSSVLAWAGIILLVAGVARADEAFKPDEEGFIRNWLVLAPLPFGGAQDGAEALGKQQVPDEALAGALVGVVVSLLGFNLYLQWPGLWGKAEGQEASAPPAKGG